jgi:hypothetical protein
MASEYERRIAAAVATIREECYARGRSDAQAEAAVAVGRLIQNVAFFRSCVVSGEVPEPGAEPYP